ncbi:putative nuclease HARBI1 [Diabrotica virgifera virgifera]|uniref:DDE Tnp4 domain-containing protein n=1 Tax=Diabrotica virgifera virgifera TaxID=50390 RepID=A0ABM5L5H0_DIAVI|nr:putative nuclease HARBI1 [Diabrotica virgifera virgifera]
MENFIEEVFFGDDEIIPAVINEVIDLAQPPQNIIPEERQQVTRNEQYYEYTIPRYTNDAFREHFRMSRVTFERLFNCIRAVHHIEDRLVPLEKKILFTVWVIGKPESFLAAGDRFGLAKSSAHKIFYQIVDELGQITNQYIRWPNMQKIQQTANVFELRSRGIPGVVGAIDGCHIPIKQPVRNANDFYNRKGFHSIILQGVCDENGVFIDVNIGRPRRMHDARVFRLSEIYEYLTRENSILPANLHLIADSAYPLLLNLMKPFQDNGHLPEEHVVYNTKLSSIRSTIERAFGLLKCKFRRLKYLDVNHSQIASRIVLAACVLHNFILLQGNAALDDYDIVNAAPNENMIEGVHENDLLVNDASNKRREIVQICNRENN